MACSSGALISFSACHALLHDHRIATVIIQRYTLNIVIRYLIVIVVEERYVNSWHGDGNLDGNRVNLVLCGNNGTLLFLLNNGTLLSLLHVFIGNI